LIERDASTATPGAASRFKVSSDKVDKVHFVKTEEKPWNGF